MPLLSIVLPCYNPPKGWEQHVLSAFKEITERIHHSPAVIVVSDGSDATIEPKAIEFLMANIPDFTFLTYSENQGKGYAVRYGVGKTASKFIIYTDIDFPYTVDSFVSIWEQLQKGNDIVSGVKDAAYYKNVPKIRVRISKFLRKVIGFFFSMPITDTQCGLKGFNERGKQIFMQTTINRYLADLEFIYKAFRSKGKMKIVPQPVSLREGVIFRKMNWRVLVSEGWNFLRIMFRKKI